MSKITTAATGQHSNAGFTHSWKRFLFCRYTFSENETDYSNPVRGVPGLKFKDSVGFFSEYLCEECGVPWEEEKGVFIVLGVIKLKLNSLYL